MCRTDGTRCTATCAPRIPQRRSRLRGLIPVGLGPPPEFAGDPAQRPTQNVACHRLVAGDPRRSDLMTSTRSSSSRPAPERRSRGPAGTPGGVFSAVPVAPEGRPPPIRTGAPWSCEGESCKLKTSRRTPAIGRGDQGPRARCDRPGESGVSGDGGVTRYLRQHSHAACRIERSTGTADPVGDVASSS